MSRDLSAKPGATRDWMYKIHAAVLDLITLQSGGGEDLTALEESVEAMQTHSATPAVVGVWIDDLPIYRKVIDLGALPNATGKNVAHGLTGISEVVRLVGIANNDDTGFAGALPLPSNVIALAIDATNVVVTTASDLTAYDQAYAIVEYTLLA